MTVLTCVAHTLPFDCFIVYRYVGWLLLLLIQLEMSDALLHAPVRVGKATIRSGLKRGGTECSNTSKGSQDLLSCTSDFSEPLSQSRTLMVGVIADIQYAPIPDGTSYSGAPRYYRHALHAAREAGKHFEREKVHLAVNLGDIVDGKCQSIAQYGGDPTPYGDSPGRRAVDEVLHALEHYKSGPFIHVYGNHCLYNLSRKDLSTKLGIPFVTEESGDLVGYRSFKLGMFRFVVLDTYDIHKDHRCPATSQKYQEAHSILSKENPNYPHNENSPIGLQGIQKRFVAFNGGVGNDQLRWLNSTLSMAREHQEKVIILSHQTIHPYSSTPMCLIWNFEEVLAKLREYRDVVVASFSGHAHRGSYVRDEDSGIHFCVFEAVLETPPPGATYAIVYLHDSFLEIQGYGQCHSAMYSFDHLPCWKQKMV
jgi:manganese-dependent ADP-ribose/CDP-alcohol diphosphatase